MYFEREQMHNSAVVPGTKKREETWTYDSRLVNRQNVFAHGVLMGLFLVCFVLPAKTLHGADDRVVKQNGEVIRGTVKKELMERVRVNVEEDNQKEISRDQIDQIVYGDMTFARVKAMQALQTGNAQKALRNAQEAMKQIKEGTLRKLHRPWIRSYLAEAKFLLGNFESAREDVEKLFEEQIDHPVFFPSARIKLLSHVYSQTEGSISREVDSGTVESIQSKFNEVRRMLRETSPSESMLWKMDYLEGILLEELGRSRLARNIYSSLQDRAMTEEQEREIMAGKARTYYDSLNDQNWRGNLTSTENILEQIKNTGEEPKKSPSYHLVKGIRSLIQLRKNSGDRSRHRETLMSLLNHVTTWFPEWREISYAHRWSLLRIGDLYRKLSKNAKEDESRMFFSKQSRKTFIELRELYPYTSQGFVARERLEK